MNKLLGLKRTILRREAKLSSIKERVKRRRGRKHVLDPLADDLAETRRVVLEDFLHPLKESREAKTTILPAALLLQLKQDLFKTVDVKKFTQASLSPSPGPSVHVHACQVIDVVVVIVVVVVVVCVDDADDVYHCVDCDAGKCHKAERGEGRAGRADGATFKSVFRHLFF